MHHRSFKLASVRQLGGGDSGIAVHVPGWEECTEPQPSVSNSRRCVRNMTAAEVGFFRSACNLFLADGREGSNSVVHLYASVFEKLSQDCEVLFGKTV